MSLKLVYFKMQALAEAPQMLMRYAGIEYEYVMAWEYFGREWAAVKPELMFKKLPLLVVDDRHEIVQSVAILNYLEARAGLRLPDPVVAARAEAILIGAQEMVAPLNPTVNFATGEDFIEMRKKTLRFLKSRFDDLQRILAASSGKFLLDDTPRACDFAAFHNLDLTRHLDPQLLPSWPRLADYAAAIAELPAVRAYLASRPQLTDVSTAPKLMIDGVAHPTGTEKS